MIRSSEGDCARFKNKKAGTKPAFYSLLELYLGDYLDLYQNILGQGLYRYAGTRGL